MKTRITELLGIKYPILQGGMALIAENNLAAAVSGAGGLGIIAASNLPASHICNEINLCRSKNNLPFGVNIMLQSEHSEEIAKVVIEEGVPVITTGAGDPSRYMEMWKTAGITVIPVVASVAMAKRMERYGADAVVVEGTEAGGHIGWQTSMVLIPQVVDAVTIPVIAAGGIGDGRGAAAAFMLGAEGVQIGTRFVVAHESRAHANYKSKIINAKDIDTQITGMSTGHPVRIIRSKLGKKYLELEKAGAAIEELERLTAGSLAKAVVEGDEEKGSFMAGQIAGMIRREQTCSEIIEEIVKETMGLLRYKGIEILDG